MKLHRSVIISTFAITLFSLTACSPSGVQVLSHRKANSQDAVLAIRISPQLSDFAHGSKHGWIALVAEDGTVQAVDVGAMDIGKVLWLNDTIYFSSLRDEFSLTDNELKKLSRMPEEAVHSSIMPNENNDGYVSMYNVGFLKDGYGYRIVAGNENSFDSWDVDGLYSSIHNCDGRIVGITDATELSKNSPGFIHKKFTNEGYESIDVLRVLYPKKEALEKNYLGIVKNDTVLEQQSFNSPCANGIAYTLGISHLAPDDSVAHEDIPPPDLILRAWDTQTGEHEIHPLQFKDQPSLNLTADDIALPEGMIFESNYLWATLGGVLYSTDITNGLTTRLYDFNISYVGRTNSRIEFTEKGIFVLKIENQVNTGEFIFYDFKTGKVNHLFTAGSIPSLLKYHGMRMYIRDIAVRPEWVEQRFASTTDVAQNQ